MQDAPFHPLAGLFPLMAEPELDELADDVRRNGTRDPVVIHEGKILDGRGRFLAWVRLGLSEGGADNFFAKRTQQPFRIFDPAADGDPLDFLVSRNLHRRHLSTTQRAIAAAEYATLRRGRPAAPPVMGPNRKPANLPVLEPTGQVVPFPTRAPSQPELGARFKVSERTVREAKALHTVAAPDLVAAAKAGDVSLNAAAAIAQLPLAEQKAIIAEVARDPAGRKAFSAVAKDLRNEKLERQQAERHDRALRLGEKARALPDRRYQVILSDCEWQFATYAESGMGRSAANHYPTSPLLDLCRRDVRGIAADDCILLHWATVPMLMEALIVADAWGFMRLDRDPATGFLALDRSASKYVSHLAWLKDRIITGHWNRGKHEVLLMFTRGHPVAPAKGDPLLPSWFEATAAEIPSTGIHSQKPVELLDWIDELWPSPIPKIELNRRGAPRLGWDAWGNEATAGSAA